MCGLKPAYWYASSKGVRVTPHVGVWIETPIQVEILLAMHVTPHVGVWIETFSSFPVRVSVSVTPHVGVWIETEEADQAKKS